MHVEMTGTGSRYGAPGSPGGARRPVGIGSGSSHCSAQSISASAAVAAAASSSGCSETVYAPSRPPVPRGTISLVHERHEKMGGKAGERRTNQADVVLEELGRLDQRQWRAAPAQLFQHPVKLLAHAREPQRVQRVVDRRPSVPGGREGCSV